MFYGIYTSRFLYMVTIGFGDVLWKLYLSWSIHWIVFFWKWNLYSMITSTVYNYIIIMALTGYYGIVMAVFFCLPTADE